MTEVLSKVSLHLLLAPHDFSCHWAALSLRAGAWGLVVESWPAHMWPRPKAGTYTEPIHKTSRNAPYQFLSLRCPPSQVQVTLAAQNFHFFLLSLMRLQFHLGSNHSAVQQESTLQSERGGAESSCRVYPALPEDYIFTSQESQKHLPTQLSCQLISSLWKRNFCPCFEVIQLPMRSSNWKHYHLNEFLEGKLSVFLFLICVFFNSCPCNPIPFLFWNPLSLKAIK